jgi:hypothetical protein
MEVTEVLDSWPEVGQRHRQWFTPAEAAIHVYAPELSILIRTFSEEKSRQTLSHLQHPRAIWQTLESLFRSQRLEPDA